MSGRVPDEKFKRICHPPSANVRNFAERSGSADYVESIDFVHTAA
jgi:hypothetical protein